MRVCSENDLQALINKLEGYELIELIELMNKSVAAPKLIKRTNKCKVYLEEQAVLKKQNRSPSIREWIAIGISVLALVLSIIDFVSSRI